MTGATAGAMTGATAGATFAAATPVAPTPATPAAAAAATAAAATGVAAVALVIVAPAIAPVVAPVAPSVKPKFGDYYPGSNTIVWIGGPPKADFSESYQTTLKSPFAVRGLSPESKIKGYAKRVVDGCPTKFKRDDPDFSLMAFANEALRHMETTGMDTVFYMKGVDQNGKGGEELFTYHSKYTKLAVVNQIELQKIAGIYDSYTETCM